MTGVSVRAGVLVTLLAVIGWAHASGETLYQSLCLACHGAQGMGDGPGVPEGVIRPRPFAANAFKFDTDADWETGTDNDLAAVIREGAQAYGGSPLMPPWSTLSEEEIASLVSHIRSLQQKSVNP